MTIKNSILDKYSKIEDSVRSNKTTVIEIVKAHTGTELSFQEINIKEKVVNIQASSVVKYIILEKKIEIERDLINKNLQVTSIQ